MSSEKEGNRQPELLAFGDWRRHLNRAEGRCTTRISTVWSTLDAEAIKRGFTHASTAEKQKIAFCEIEAFIDDAVAWCRLEQDRGTWIASPFTESREAEVIAAVHRILDGIPKKLTDTDDAHRELVRSCESRKPYFKHNLIRPRFYDGRADFQPTKNAAPTSESCDWLCDIAWSVYELVGSDKKSLERFRKMVRQGSREFSQFLENNTRVEGEEDARRWKDDDAERFGTGALQLGPIDTSAKKWTVLAAIYDHCLDDIRIDCIEPVEAINPWRNLKLKAGLQNAEERKATVMYLVILKDRVPNLREKNSGTLREWLADVSASEITCNSEDSEINSVNVREPVTYQTASRVSKVPKATITNRVSKVKDSDPCPSPEVTMKNGKKIWKFQVFQPWFNRQFPDKTLPDSYERFSQILSSLID